MKKQDGIELQQMFYLSNGKKDFLSCLRYSSLKQEVVEKKETFFDSYYSDNLSKSKDCKIKKNKCLPKNHSLVYH